MDRITQMSLVAAKSALESAQLVLSNDVGKETGIVFNTWFGPLQTVEDYIDGMCSDGSRVQPASLYPLTVPNAFTGLVTMELKVFGPNLTVSGSSAVRFAVDAIRQGQAKVMLTGGSEELTPTSIESYRFCGLLPSKHPVTSRFVAAEGSIVLALEDAASARARGAPVLAEIVDCACGNLGRYTDDPFDFDADSIARTMHSVLDRTGIHAHEVGVFVSGDNAAPGLIEIERDAIKSVFGSSGLQIHYPKYEFVELGGASDCFTVLRGALLATKHPPLKGGSERQPYLLVNNYELGGGITSVLLRSPHLHS